MWKAGYRAMVRREMTGAWVGVVPASECHCMARGCPWSQEPRLAGLGKGDQVLIHRCGKMEEGQIRLMSQAEQVKKRASRQSQGRERWEAGSPKAGTGLGGGRCRAL